MGFTNLDKIKFYDVDHGLSPPSYLGDERLAGR